MTKRVICMLLSFAVIASCYFSVFAADVKNIAATVNITDKVIDSASNKIVIAGKAPMGIIINIKILHKDVEIDELDTMGDDIGSVILYLDEVTVGSDNSFVFEQIITTGTGNYNFRLTSEGQIIMDSSFYYTSIRDMQNLLNDIYQEKDNLNQVIKTIKDNSVVLGIDTPLLQRLLSANIALDNAVKKVTEKKYDSFEIEEFRNVFYKSIAVTLFNSMTGADIIMSLEPQSTTSIVDVFGLNEGNNQKRYALFNKLSQSGKETLAARFVSKRGYTAESIPHNFNTNCFLAYVGDVLAWETIEELITDNADIISNASVFTSQTSNVRAIAAQTLYAQRKTFSDMADFESKLNAAVSAAISKNNQPGGSRSSSGGGRGGVTSTEPYVPVQVSDVVPMDKVERLFDDLDSASWAADAINILALRGIVNGKEPGRFSPNDFITREEFVKIAVLAFEVYDLDAVCNFNDVSVTDWYYQYIASGFEVGAIRGVSDTDFGVGMNLSRQELTTLAYRFGQAKGIDFGNEVQIIPFDDQARIADYAVEAVAGLSNSGIINGIGGNLFAPEEACTRAQAAKIIHQITILNN